MCVAGIDAHATYSVIAIVSNTGQLVHGPVRINTTEADRLVELFEPFRPREVVVETTSAWLVHHFPPYLGLPAPEFAFRVPSIGPYPRRGARSPVRSGRG